MTPEINSVVREMGFAPGAKVVVPHQDDVGMCHGANVAFAELANRGFITCGSVMVTCPWFREAADIAVARPDLDLGVHLTLTSEWQHYRWRPLTGARQASGLVDADGYMWRTVKLVREHAVPEAVEAELRAQIDAALAAGIDVTHLDAHMGAAHAPEFAAIYYRLGREYGLPVSSLGAIGIHAGAGREIVPDQPDRHGPPLFDILHETPWVPQEKAFAAYRGILKSVEPGVTVLALHCNAPGDIEIIDPPRAHCRTTEYGMFKDPWFLSFVDELELTLVGFREIRAIVRQQKAMAPELASEETSRSEVPSVT